MTETPSPGRRRLHLVLDGRLVRQTLVRLSGRTLWVNAALVATRWGAQLDVGEDVLGWRDTRSSRTIVFRRGSPRAEVDGQAITLSGCPDWSDGTLLLPVDGVAAAGNARWFMDRRMGVLFLTRPDPYLQPARILIDPGHGGRESGAELPDGTPEKELNLAVARRLAALVRSSGAAVALTRTADRTVPGATRCRLARQFQATVAVSIHHLPRSERPPAAEAYYGSRGDSRRLAAALAAALAGEMGVAGRGVSPANVGLLGGLPCPGAVTQLEWPAGPTGERESRPEWLQLREALALMGGLRAYCSEAERDSVAWPSAPL